MTDTKIRVLSMSTCLIRLLEYTILNAYNSFTTRSAVVVLAIYYVYIETFLLSDIIPCSVYRYTCISLL